MVQTTETTTAVTAAVSMVIPTSASTTETMGITNSGCRQCVDFCALTLFLFVANFLTFFVVILTLLVIDGFVLRS